MSAPDLQALVAQHGGWQAIPPEAWRAWDAATAAWTAAHRERCSLRNVDWTEHARRVKAALAKIGAG